MARHWPLWSLRCFWIVATFFILTGGAPLPPQLPWSCKSLTERNCVTFLGDLILTSSTTEDELKDLEIIRGSLIIKDTTLVSLDIPKLHTIAASKAPAFVIKNNAKLKSINMPKITNVTGPSQPLIEISGNPQLEGMENFIPSSMLALCTRHPAAVCFHAEHDDGSTKKDKKWWLVWILSGVGLLFVLLGIAAIYWVFSYRNKKRKENKKGKPKPGQPDGKPPPPAKMTSKTSSKDTVNTENIADITNSTESTKIADTTITSEAKDESTQSSGLQTLSSHKSGVSSSSDLEKLHFGKMGMMNLRFLLEADTLKSHSGLFQRSPKNDEMKSLKKSVGLASQASSREESTLRALSHRTGKIGGERRHSPIRAAGYSKKIGTNIPRGFRVIHFICSEGEKTQPSDFKGRKPTSSLQHTLPVAGNMI